MAPNPTIRIGVLFVDTAIQLLDLSPIDIFGMFDKTYLSVTPFPAAIKAGAVPMRILYINEAGPNALQECTSRAALRVDASISDEICAPPPTKVMKQKKKNNGEAEKQEKTLDILLIPGPDPEKYKGSAAINGFIRGHFESGTDVLTVCTGILAAGFAGILKGKRVTGPRELVPDFKKKFPEAVWEEKRWTSDGNLWSSGMSVISSLRPTSLLFDFGNP